MKALCRFALFALIATGLLGGCATNWEESAKPRLRAGMSRDDVRFFFGNPSRIETLPTGGEDWYYSFAFWTPAQVQSAAEVDPYGGGGVSVAVTAPAKRTVQQCPVHLSPEGFVIEPLPAGELVGR